MLNFKILKKHKIGLSLITGLSLKEFEGLIKKVNPEWQRLIQKKEAVGRPHGLKSLEDKVLAMLIYYRIYVTQRFIGVLMNVDNSTICRGIKRIEKLVIKVIKIKKVRTLSQAELENILVDCTEQPVERPTKRQKRYYSGKKKMHTIKTELVVTKSEGKPVKIISISKAHLGKTHDYKVRKCGAPFHPKAKIYGDSAYIGLKKTNPEAKIPIKKTKKNNLNSSQKAYNMSISKVRIFVEHAIGKIKRFKIMSDRYRNKRVGHNLKFNLIAGIVNFKSGY